jgi:hypothetical protein
MKYPWVGASLALGGAGGAVLASGIGMRWNSELANAVTNPVTATWLAALSGAALGGLISYALARQSSRETLRRDADARTAEEHVSSLRAMVTAMQISNRLFTMNLDLESAAKAPGPTGPWASLKPNAGPGSKPPEFQPVDFVPFINNKKSDIVHRGLLLQERLNALEAGFDAYREMRQDFENFAAPFTKIDSSGAMATFFPPAEAAAAQIKISVMNGLVEQMVSYSREYLADAKSLCDDMSASHLAYFGGRTNFRLAYGKDGEPLPAQREHKEPSP